MADVLSGQPDQRNTANMHSGLLAAYAVSEAAVKEKIQELLLAIEQTSEIEPRYLLAKALVFGNLVNIKWLYYHNRLNDFVLQNIENANIPVYEQNYLQGIKLYSDIIKPFGETLDKESKFEQYIAYELYRILCMSDDIRRALQIPLHGSLPNDIQEQLESLKTILVRILGQVGYSLILVDYNAYFLAKSDSLSPQQMLTVLNNYETVVKDFGIPLSIQDQAREALFYIYLKGKYGIPIDQARAMSYLDNSTDYSLLEAVGFDLYYGNNPLIKQDKAMAQTLFSRCFANSEKVSAWSKVNEPTWYAEFERRNKALESFFKSGSK